jgi:hypothetical protein
MTQSVKLLLLFVGMSMQLHAQKPEWSLNAGPQTPEVWGYSYNYSYGCCLQGPCPDEFGQVRFSPRFELNLLRTAAISGRFGWIAGLGSTLLQSRTTNTTIYHDGIRDITTATSYEYAVLGYLGLDAVLLKHGKFSYHLSMIVVPERVFGRHTYFNYNGRLMGTVSYQTAGFDLRFSPFLVADPHYQDRIFSGNRSIVSSVGMTLGIGLNR